MKLKTLPTIYIVIVIVPITVVVELVVDKLFYIAFALDLILLLVDITKKRKECKLKQNNLV